MYSKINEPERIEDALHYYLNDGRTDSYLIAPTHGRFASTYVIKSKRGSKLKNVAEVTIHRANDEVSITSEDHVRASPLMLELLVKDMRQTSSSPDTWRGVEIQEQHYF